MLSFTLDTNCIIAVDEERPQSSPILRLAAAHGDGTADVAAVAIMASEKQRSGATLENFEKFKERLNSLGLGHLGMCLPMMFWDITFWGNCLWADQKMIDLDVHIHRILFPNIEPSFQAFCANRGLSGTMDIADKQKAIWRNAKCDVQAIWSHINAGRDVFVSSDKNFHDPIKMSRLIEIGAGRIETPENAMNLINQQME